MELFLGEAACRAAYCAEPKLEAGATGGRDNGAGTVEGLGVSHGGRFAVEEVDGR